MRFTTKTEYGLLCLIYMARNGEHTLDPVTIKELAREERYSQTYIEKILQALRGAGIVVSQHGNQGGYRLSRPPAKITLREVIESLEGSTFEVFCEPGVREEITCTHFPGCQVKSVWERTKAVLDDLYGSLTLESVARGGCGGHGTL
jgi:Rrf2 family protein